MPVPDRDLGAEAHQIGGDPRWRARRGAHEHERVDPVGPGEHHPAGDHASHRMPEQVEAVEAEGVGDGEHVRGETVERVGGRFLGRLALAVTAQVERGHAMRLRERCEMVGEVLLRAAEAVYQEQRGGIVA